MKTSIYFLSVVISTFFGSIFLMQTADNLSNEKQLEKQHIAPIWKKNYSNCEKIIDSIEKNNEITKKNFTFVKEQLTQIN